MSTKDWIVLLVPIICNGIIVFAFQKILSKKASITFPMGFGVPDHLSPA